MAVGDLIAQADECYALLGITITGKASSFPRPKLLVLLSRANLIKTIELPLKRGPKSQHHPPGPRRQERTSF